MKDAFWQILGRVISAIGGFLVIKIMSPYLGPFRYGDYSTILKYFAIWSALADFWLYVIALRELGKLKEQASQQLEIYYAKFVSSRVITITIVYTLALVAAYLIPSYTSNPYIVRGLPLGMIFSASFMSAGILQLPLQLFWQMKHVSIGLTVARISQLIVLAGLVFLLYPTVSFDSSSSLSLRVFVLILATVVVSWVSQTLYVWILGNRFLPLKWIVDWKFTWNILTTNRQYGFAYYLSSFHTLIVLILLSIFYPTIQQFPYVGIRAIALSLIEILLIVPSSLGNSLIHKISSATLEQKRQSFGNLIVFIARLGGLFALNFWIFATPLITFIWGTKFLSTTLGNAWADTILPWLGVVLIMSFVKQIFNYLFVATERQNSLLIINLIGVAIGTSIGLWAIIHYNVTGWIIAQLTLEFLFMSGAMIVAWRGWVFPRIDLMKLIVALGGLGAIGTLWMISGIAIPSFLHFIAYALAINAIILALSYRPMITLMKGISGEGQEISDI